MHASLSWLIAALALVCAAPLGVLSAQEKLPPGALIRFGSDDMRDGSSGRVLFLPDGKTLVSAGWKLKMWDVASRKLIADFPNPAGYPQKICCSPRGDRLYLLANSLFVVNAADGKVLHTIDGIKGGWSAVAVSPDEKFLAAGTFDGDILLWELPSGKRLPNVGRHEFPREPTTEQKDRWWIWNLAFHPTRPLLASAGRDSTVRVWDLKAGKELWRFGKPVGTVCMFTPDGKHLMTNDAFINKDGYWASSKLMLWNLDTGAVDRECAGWLGHDAAWSRDGKRLVTGGGNRSMVVYDIENGKEAVRWPRVAFNINTLDFSVDGNLIALSGHGLDLWDVKAGKSLLDAGGHTGGINGIRLSPDGATLATASADESVRIWDVNTGKQLHKLMGAKSGVYSPSFAPKENVLATAEQGGIRFWDLRSGRSVRFLDFKQNIWWVEYLPDGLALAVGGDDLSVRIIDGDSGKVLRTLEGYPSSNGVGLSFLLSPDGKSCLRPARDGGPLLSSIETGALIKDFDLPGGAPTAAFSPDGKLLALGGKEVAFYDLAKLKKVGSLGVECHGPMRFTPDNKRLLVGGACYDIAGGKKLFELPTVAECLEIDAKGRRAFTTEGRGCSVLAWDLEGRR